MKYVSIILPLYGLNKYLNTDQFKYNYYWKLGTPIHITFIYNMELSEYNKNKKDILIALKNILNTIKKCNFKLEKIGKLNKLVYLEPSKKVVEILKKIHNMFLKRFKMDPEKQIYKKFHKDYKPHVTIVTGHNKNIDKIYDSIKVKYDKMLPLDFTVKKFWVYIIDKKNEKATKLIDVVEI